MKKRLWLPIPSTYRLALLAVALWPTVAATQVAVPPQCSGWSTPQVLWESPQDLGMLQPADAMTLMVDEPHSVAVVASFRAVLPGDTSHAMLIRQPGQPPPPLPAGGHYFLGPAGLRSAGVVDLIWAEPEPSTGAMIFDYDGAPVLRILHSRYAQGGWSRPEQVGETQGFLQWLLGRSRLVADETGVLHMVYLDSRSRLVHLHRANGDWLAAEIPATALPGLKISDGGGNPVLLTGPGGGLILAYTVGAADRQHGTQHPNSILIRRFDVADGTWSDATVAFLSNGTPAMNPEFVRGRADSLHLFWGVPERLGPSPTRGIMHSVSADGGVSWSAPRAVPLPWNDEGPGEIRAATSPDGRVHLMFTSSRRAHRQLWRSVFSNSGMSEPVRVFPDTTRRASNFEFGFDRDGNVHLVWASAERWREGDFGFRDLRLLYATRPYCESGS